MIFDRSVNRWLVALTLCVIPLAISVPCFFGSTWAAGDLIRQFYPWKELGRQALMNGNLPLWNTDVFCGMPLAGNFQSGLFYPLHFYFYFMPFAQALGIHLGLHYFLSGLGFYILARGLKFSRTAALLAALAWSGNAFLLARVEFMSALSAYAWTPWILAAFVMKKSWPFAAVFIGLQALAGYPLELGFTFGASLLINLSLPPLAPPSLSTVEREGGGDSSRGDWVRFLLAWLSGLALGAIVLLPGLELLGQSSRAAGMADAVQNFQLTLADLKAWFLPVSGVAWAKIFSISLATVALAPFARGRVAKVAWLFCALGLFLSFGFLNPALNRHPTLALVWLSLGLALLTGLGSEKITRLPLLGLAAAFLIFQPLLFSSQKFQLISSEVYQPQAAAKALASKITPQRRFLLSPAVQEERNSGGSSLTTAWLNFPGWLQANTAAPLDLKDANGYDPLAPAGIVAKLNAVSFPKFAKDEDLLNSLGVEALVDWQAPGTISIRKRQGAVPRALFFKTKPVSNKDLRKGIALGLSEPSPEELRVSLPAKHEAGWVFVNDTYYPGWKANVDGAQVTIERGLEAFRITRVEKDTKELVFQYRPLSVLLGALLSLVAFAFLIFATVRLD